MSETGVHYEIMKTKKPSRRYLPASTVLCLVLSVAGLLLSSQRAVHASLAKKVIGNLVTWDQARGFQDIQSNIDALSEVTAQWYTITTTGGVVPYRDGNGSPYVDPAIVSYLHNHQVPITVGVQNIVNGVWDGNTVSQILNNTTSRSTHVNNIVAMVVANGYDGVDLDYENLLAANRSIFSQFITELALALHQQNKTLSVDVVAKTAEPGTWSTPQAQDWSSIGAAADQMRIMIYGYSWSTSLPGSVAPINWVNDVLAFAKTVVPSAKIIHGIPAYGIDWPSRAAGTEYMWDTLSTLATNNHASVQWDSVSKSPWFQYTSSGNLHTIWFENAQSTDAKLAATNQHDVGGIFLWRLGGEDPAIWPIVRNRFGTGAVPLPSVDIRANGSTGPITIPYATAAIISWTSANASSCDISPTGWSGVTNNGMSTGNLTTSLTYTATCHNATGDTSDSVSVDVAAQPATDTQAPMVTITQPVTGTAVTKKISIVATATDNVRVTKVIFFVDAVAVATDTVAPYSVGVSTGSWQSGPHVITAVAYDAAGNAGIAEVTVNKR